MVSGCSDTPTQLTLPKAATKVAIGGYHTCALLVDGTVYCSGNNDSGEIGDGESGYANAVSTPAMALGLSNAVDISLGIYTTYALIGDSVYGWGGDIDCELLNLTGSRGSQVHQQLTPTLIPGLSSAVALISNGPLSLMACAVLNNP